MHKKPIKALLSILFFCCWLSQNSFAQVKIESSIGYLLPMGKLNHNYQFGIQSSLGVFYPVHPSIKLIANAGYSYIKGVHIEDHYLQYSIADLKALPVNVGLHYDIDQIFFLGMSGGPMWMVNQNWQSGWQYAGFIGARYHKFSLRGKLMQWNKGGIINFAGIHLSYSF